MSLSRETVFLENFASDEDVIATISRKFNDLLALKKVEISKIALYTGMSEAGLRKLRRGEGNPTVFSLNKLASFFGVPITYLFSIDEEQKSKIGLKSLPVYPIETYPKSEVLKYVVTKKVEYALVDFIVTLTSNMLSPAYMVGTFLYIQQDALLESGETYFISTNSGNMLCRYLDINANGIFLPLHGNLDKSFQKDNDVVIYGKVIASSLI
ncbi:helix-turn-helix domain-containing protein [Facilibium subflavum]|uniref:helix-turn-helix domain-containing protein n=1 Tax=Facilibium subflavum TaxID=2219058 RepID=UPI0013C2B52C|nr:helix-turn-helix transcriptional regulator [Facilibium subflavum]